MTSCLVLGYQFSRSITSGFDHFRFRSLPVSITSGFDHFRFRSLPVSITSGFDHFRFRSLPVSITSGFDFRSLPVSITSGFDHFRFRSLPVSITSGSHLVLFADQPALFIATIFPISTPTRTLHRHHLPYLHPNPHCSPKFGLYRFFNIFLQNPYLLTWRIWRVTF